MQLPYDGKGAILPITVERFQALRAHAKDTLNTIRRVMLSEADESTRYLFWNEIIVARKTRSYGKEEWRAFFMHWVLDVQGEAYVEDRELAEQFLIKELKTSKQSGLFSITVAALRGRLEPELSSDSLVEIAFELEQERTRDELFRYFAPRAIVTAINLFPIARVPLLLGHLVQAITGFVQFMQFLEEAEEDGDITDDELEEAKWQMAGIIPFNAVQMVLLGRGIGLVAYTFLVALRSGLADFADLMVRVSHAVREGWTGYGEYDLDTAVFLPDYVIKGDDE